MLVNHNVITLHGRSSMRLEPSFWDALDEICRARKITRSALVQEVERGAGRDSLTGSVRVYILDHYRRAAA